MRVQEALAWAEAWENETERTGMQDALVCLVAEVRRLQEGWATEAQRYAQNADYWRGRSEDAEKEVRRLQNKLNTDSQNFEIECLKARAEAAEKQIEQNSLSFHTIQTALQDQIVGLHTELKGWVECHAKLAVEHENALNKLSAMQAVVDAAREYAECVKVPVKPQFTQWMEAMHRLEKVVLECAALAKLDEEEEQ